jgi:hypothetical protein
MFTTLRRPRRMRAGFVLAACLSVVAAMFSVGSPSARADSCFVAPPWTIQVTGPNGAGTTQAPDTQLQLQALDAGGRPVSTNCGVTLTW